MPPSHELTEETPLHSNIRKEGTEPIGIIDTARRASLDIPRYLPSSENCVGSKGQRPFSPIFKVFILVSGIFVVVVALFHAAKALHRHPSNEPSHIGPYKLVQSQQGESFFDFYEFYNGADSLGSAGYNSYEGPKSRAEKLGLANVTFDDSTRESFAFLKSAPTKEGPRQSVRLEGKQRFNNGLFILDVRHMPVGCGVWPAFWLTDEDVWPDNGEIDIVEGVNFQTSAKTALHTSKDCSMYAHVPDFVKTGTWDRATCIPNTWTGELNCETSKEADDCWAMAAHQWANQGCVGVDTRNGTIGKPLNQKGGGVYVLEWDPANYHIRSWVFTHDTNLPQNLLAVTTPTAPNEDKVTPDPDKWGLPYAYFSIGDGSGCTDDHFKNMRLIFNTAFCGTVAGNRYFGDCPAEITNKYNVNNDAVLSCNAYVKSDAPELEEAYWKIRGVYIYQRS
mmetsp:Transcript_14551/g.21461  ORF Transcript_14551/g.21461 Transcript_14551/m.21461 type:complete len:449 (-) Transcript_14551:2029-3375(-)